MLSLFFLVFSEDVLDTLQEIQGTFQRIQTLARRQKDHLKRIHNDAASGNIIFLHTNLKFLELMSLLNDYRSSLTRLNFLSN